MERDVREKERKKIINQKKTEIRVARRLD